MTDTSEQMTDTTEQTNSGVEVDDTNNSESTETPREKWLKILLKRKQEYEQRKRVTRNKRYAKKTVKLFIPVSICMIIVLMSLTLLPTFATSFDYSKQVPEGSIFIENEKSSAGSRTIAAIIVAVVFLCLIIAVTTCVAILIARKCYRVINGIFIFAFAMILLIFSAIYLFVAFNTYNIPFDVMTAGIMVWNYSIVGLIAIYSSTGPTFLKRAYLVMMCALIVLFFIKLLPSWTTWVLLILLCLWDIYAVFFGPLKTIVEDDTANEKVVAPMYAAIVWFMAKDSEKLTKDSKVKSPKSDSGDGDFEIGLGDIIFYSLLIGKTYTSADMLTAIICFVCVLMGMTFTLYLLLVWKQALPALPISIVLGLLFRFFAVYLITPFNDALVSSQVFL